MELGAVALSSAGDADDVGGESGARDDGTAGGVVSSSASTTTLGSSELETSAEADADATGEMVGLKYPGNAIGCGEDGTEFVVSVPDALEPFESRVCERGGLGARNGSQAPIAYAEMKVAQS